jgi:hypothetical protein
MQVKLFWKSLKLPLLIGSIIVLSGCSILQGPERIVTQIQTVERMVPIQPRPEGLELYETQFYAVTSENYEEFAERFEKENGDLVYFAISVPGYENLSLSLADIKRYIEQQKAIIVYYENQLKPKEEPEEE